jgi:hypothetical protein
MSKKKRLAAVVVPMMVTLVAANCGTGDASAGSASATRTAAGDVEFTPAGALQLAFSLAPKQ